MRTPEGTFTATFGTAEAGTTEPIEVDQHFRIGSDTETMTGTVVLQLVDEGAISLDDAISQYRDGVPNGDEITIAQLLEMRSGLWDCTGSPELNRRIDQDPEAAIPPEELLEIAFSQPPDFEPDEEWQYSNTNTVLLGVMVEEVTGMPVAEAFAQRLSEPLGLPQTSFPAITDFSIPDPHPNGYVYGRLRHDARHPRIRRRARGCRRRGRPTRAQPVPRHHPPHPRARDASLCVNDRHATVRARRTGGGETAGRQRGERSAMTTHDAEPLRLTVYGSKSSYFTGKLETFLRYKEIPYTFTGISERVNDKIRANVGVFQVPAVELSDGRWLTDSTPIIRWAEAQYPNAPVYPADPVARYLSLVVEDFADEWLWRPAMHYRWSYPEDRFTRGTRLGAEMSRSGDRPMPQALRRKLIQQRQIGTFVRGDGVEPATRAHVDQAYLRVLDRLEPIVQARPYLLGERPSLADIAFMGPMFRHFAQDPTPAHIMAERAPGVWEWVARTWNARASRLGARPLLDEVPHDWDPLLRESAETHLEQLDANACAHAAGRAEHDLTVQGVTYRNLPTSPYRVWCLEQLRARYQELDDAAAQSVRARLVAVDAWEPLWRAPDLHSGHDPSGTAPFCRGSRVFPDELSIRAAAIHHRRSPR